MRFTKLCAFVWVLFILMLSSCANHPFSDNREPPQADVEVENAVVVEVLTPMQLKVRDLRAQPNLYSQQFLEANKALSPVVKKQFKQAMTLQANGDFDQAETLLKYLSDSQPQLSGVWMQLANNELLKSAQLNNEQRSVHLETSERYLNYAVSANQHNFKAHNLLAQVYRKKGQFTQALSHYNKALTIWPAFPEAYKNRGILYDLYLGNKTLALDDYTLYQELIESPSRQVKGWIIDLQRQLKATQTNGGTL